MVAPANALDVVRRLTADEGSCEYYQPVLTELRLRGLDSDDLREIPGAELGENHCFRSRPTERYHPATISDYYSLWIDDCGCRMFSKLLIRDGRLVITSFKKDNRYG
jgi:hypothetical protein